MSVTIEKNKANGQDELVLRLPLDKNPKPSSTGKTLLVAAHSGPTGIKLGNHEIRGSGSFYVPNPSYVKS